jgi:hypothetical protein
MPSLLAMQWRWIRCTPLVCDHCGPQQAYFLREGDLMLFTDASYMPERDTRCVGMNKMGLNRDNDIILLEKMYFD